MEAIYREASAAGIAEADVLVDYTGGTKAMTAGMVLSGAQKGRRLQALLPQRRLAGAAASHGSAIPAALCVEGGPAL